MGFQELPITVIAGASSASKAEDVASADGDTGVPAMAIRKASPANTSGTDGDYEMLQMSAGRLWVDPSGVSLTVGTHAVTVASGGVASGAVASGAIASGALASGSIGSGAVASGAIASGAFASGSIAAGAIAAGATSFVKTEDTPSADLDAGVPAMAVRKASPANTSNTDGDYEMLQMSAGRLWSSTTIDAAIPAGNNNIGDVDIASGTVTSVTQFNGQAISMGTGARDAGTQRVTIATNDAVPVTDNSSSLTVDAPVGTPVFVRLSDGSSAIATLPVSIAAGATSIAKAEDVLSADADVGVPAMAVRKATPANVSGSDGDYEFLQVSAGRLWASATIDAALPAGAALIGKVGIDQTTVGTTNAISLAQLGANAVAVNNGTASTGTQRVVIASDNTTNTNPFNVQGPTLTKGSQASTGFSVQDLKDAGRSTLSFYAVAAAAGTTTTETAITLTKSAGTASTTTGVSFVVTSGKRFRITAISFATRGNVTATLQSTTFNFRINTGGGVTTSSTPLTISCRSATPATSLAWDRVYLDCLEGYEILGDGTLQFGVTAAATYVTNAPTWDVNIIGYEY